MSTPSPVEFFRHPHDYNLSEDTEEKFTEGWYYWYVQPGCLPDSDPIGVFDSQEEAQAYYDASEDLLDQFDDEVATLI